MSHFILARRPAIKLIWRTLKNITADSSRSTRKWSETMDQFASVHVDPFARRYLMQYTAPAAVVGPLVISPVAGAFKGASKIQKVR